MLAALFYGPMDVRLEECSIPQPGHGELLVKVAVATTCGTDIKAFRRGHPLLFHRVPAGFGHEVSGIVAAVAKNMTQCRAGDTDVVANSESGQHCFECV